VSNLNTLLSSIHRTPRQKINKDILELNNITDEMDLTDIYKVFHPTEVHGTFSKMDVLDHKANLNNIKKLK
jgi:hypothetical protein